MSTVHDILSVKGSLVHTISGSSSVADAIKKMTDKQVGCLVVIRDDSSVSGIISERDVMRRLAAGQEDLSKLPVSDVMTAEVIVCTYSDGLNRVRSIMKTHWVRQIPVIAEDGKLLGIISIGDVNAYLIGEEETEIKYLHDYIHGHVR
ncbi:MAG: CBS domain-containing protein [Planctomycetota bacterium]|nr:CBS domain-containing protein [Planctomycetota bacterium]